MLRCNIVTTPKKQITQTMLTRPEEIGLCLSFFQLQVCVKYSLSHSHIYTHTINQSISFSWKCVFSLRQYMQCKKKSLIRLCFFHLFSLSWKFVFSFQAIHAAQRVSFFFFTYFIWHVFAFLAELQYFYMLYISSI